MIQNRQQLHETLAEQLELPDWYGRNLDALWDCLTEESAPVSICITDPTALQANLGDYYGLLLRVLEEASDVKENLTLMILQDNC